MSNRSALCLALILDACLCGCDSASKEPSRSQEGNPSPSMSSRADEAVTGDSPTSAEPKPRAKSDPAASPPPTAQPSPAVSGPKWKCEQPRFDFGEVWAGTPVRHPFILENVGNQVLNILEAKPRCSCSMAANYTRAIAPRGTGTIPFVLNTTNKSGFVDEWLTIRTDDPSKPNITIYLNGVVKTVCSLEVIANRRPEEGPESSAELQKVGKQQGNFGRITANDRLYRVIRMTNTVGSPLSLEIASINPPGTPFKANLEEVTPGEVFELTLEANPPYRIERPRASVTFRTNVPDKRYYNLPVSAYLPPRIEVVPYKIVVDRRSFGVKRRVITVRNNGPTPMEVTSVAASDPNYQLSVLAPAPDKPNETRIELFLPAGDYRPPPFGEIVRIETTDADKSPIDLMVLPDLRRPATPRPTDRPLTFYPAKTAQQG